MLTSKIAYYARNSAGRIYPSLLQCDQTSTRYRSVLRTDYKLNLPTPAATTLFYLLSFFSLLGIISVSGWIFNKNNFAVIFKDGCEERFSGHQLCTRCNKNRAQTISAHSRVAKILRGHEFPAIFHVCRLPFSTWRPILAFVNNASISLKFLIRYATIISLCLSPVMFYLFCCANWPVYCQCLNKREEKVRENDVWLSP